MISLCSSNNFRDELTRLSLPQGDPKGHMLARLVRLKQVDLRCQLPWQEFQGTFHDGMQYGALLQAGGQAEGHLADCQELSRTAPLTNLQVMGNIKLNCAMAC